jgi:hypothetical protein
MMTTLKFLGGPLVQKAGVQYLYILMLSALFTLIFFTMTGFLGITLLIVYRGSKKFMYYNRVFHKQMGNLTDTMTQIEGKILENLFTPEEIEIFFDVYMGLRLNGDYGRILAKQPCFSCPVQALICFRVI